MQTSPNRWQIPTTAIIGTLSCFAFLIGCANPRSDKIRGEVVVLTLRTNTPEAHSVGSDAVGAIVGLTVDLVKGWVESESKKFERQYGQMDYRADFWSIKATNGEPMFTPNYAGFTFQRFTKEYPQGGTDGPAMRFICEFEQPKKSRLFLIKPVTFQLNQAKAKIVNGDGAVDLTLNVAVDAMWVDASQIGHQERIAFSTFEIKNYKLPKGNTPATAKTDFGQQRAGWFPGVPISPNAGGKFPWQTSTNANVTEYFDGCFKVSVLVTERDPSGVKEDLEKAAKFIGEQKEKIVGNAKKAVE